VKSDILDGAKAVAPQFIGTVPFGVVCGVASAASGLSTLETMAMSLLVFSGVAHLAIAQLLAVGAPVGVIALVAAVISLRLIMYSASIAPLFAHLPLAWRWWLSFHLTDQVFAMSSARVHVGDEARAQVHWYATGAAVPMFATWHLAVLLGALLGSQIPAQWSLDFAVTLSFIVLLRPALRRHGDLVAALAAGAIMLMAIGLPYRTGLVLAALVGVVAGLVWDRNAPSTTPKPGSS
jgi:4-azaleucine resistance transporter AzlC